MLKTFRVRIQSSLKERKDHHGFTFLQSKVEFGVQFLTFSDIIEDDISSAVRNAALSGRTLQMKAVHTVLSGVEMKHSQVAGDCACNSEINLQKSFNKVFMAVEDSELYLDLCISII